MTVDAELLNIILTIDNLDDLNHFFEDLFTPAEINDIALRWKLLKDLHKGMAQRKIADKYGISLCKITRGSRILKKKDSIMLKILNAQQQDKRLSASVDHSSNLS
ncbi:MAG: repressor [Desulfobacterales bacterium RIFOXYA12_FULL_46_15]|nr:MAG: repressor [Desulfobacterales bacterium RIFOXYA12_FULL_46_15]